MTYVNESVTRRAFLRCAAGAAVGLAAVEVFSPLIPQRAYALAAGDYIFPNSLTTGGYRSLDGYRPRVVATAPCGVATSDESGWGASSVQEYNVAQGMTAGNGGLVAFSLPHNGSDGIPTKALCQVFDYSGNLLKYFFIPAHWSGSTYGVINSQPYSGGQTYCSHFNTAAFNTLDNMVYAVDKDRILEFRMGTIMDSVSNGTLLSYDDEVSPGVLGMLDKRASNSNQTCCVGVLSLTYDSATNDGSNPVAGTAAIGGSLSATTSMGGYGFVSVKKVQYDGSVAKFSLQRWHFKRTNIDSDAWTWTRETVNDGCYEFNLSCPNTRIARKIALQDIAYRDGKVHIVLWLEDAVEGTYTEFTGSYVLAVPLFSSGGNSPAFSVLWSEIDSLGLYNPDDDRNVVEELESIVFPDLSGDGSDMRCWVNHWGDSMNLIGGR